MSNLKRVQLDMPEKSMARLQALKIKTEASSYAEVVKNALRLYEATIEEAEQGNKLVLVSKDGSTREYIVF